MKDFAEAWDKIKEMLLWGSAQTGYPLGTIILVVAVVFTIYQFTKILRRGKE